VAPCFIKRLVMNANIWCHYSKLNQERKKVIHQILENHTEHGVEDQSHNALDSVQLSLFSRLRKIYCGITACLWLSVVSKFTVCHYIVCHWDVGELFSFSV